MGKYADLLSKRLRGAVPASVLPPAPAVESLAFAAIKRSDQVYTGHRSHHEIRLARGDEDPRKPDPLDIDGFLTSTGRFVSRYEARFVGVRAGQLGPQWLQSGRKLLSSDVW